MSQQLMTLSNGERVGTGLFAAFLELQKACKAATGYTLWITSGFRTADVQISIFLARYRLQATGGGPFNDVRWWQGRRYVRHSSAGTVAVPGTSLHERASAVDFGGDAAVAGSVVAKWLRANAARFGFSPTGYGFGEPWHYDFTGNPWAGSASTPFTPPPPATLPREDEDMQSIVVDGHHYGVAPEFISHYGTYAQAQITRYVTSATDELHKLNATQFNDLLDGLGIPRSVVKPGGGAVLNPGTNQFEANGVWSRHREILAALAKS